MRLSRWREIPRKGFFTSQLRRIWGKYVMQSLVPLLRDTFSRPKRNLDNYVELQM